MTQPDNFSRRILLDGAYNLRHVGGYETKNGRFTRPFTLFRSDNLHRITPDGQQALMDYGLRTIVDLRRTAELQNDPNVFANSDKVAYCHLPLYNEWSEINKGEPRSPDIFQLYRRILDHCQATIYRVMVTAAQPGAFPLLVHCFVGKDRTGVIIALLLGLAGVPNETITADYATSHTNLLPLFGELRQGAQEAGYDMGYFEIMLQSPSEAMAQTLAYLEKQYGGIEPYLRTIGLADFQLDHLREQLLI